MTSAPVDVDRGATEASERGRNLRSVLLVALVAAGISVVTGAGRRLTRERVHLHLLGGYVLRGSWELVLTPRVLLPVVVGLAGVLVGPALGARLRWRLLLPFAAGASALWAVALALSSGWHRLAEPLSSVYEYPHDVARVGSLGSFLSTFNASVPGDSPDPWTTHVAGHPPAALLSFVLLDRLGLHGLGWAAAMCIAGGALAVPAVLVTVRAVAGEPTARVVAPFAVLSPAALWIATSADALFTGVSAWGIALLAVAAAKGARGASGPLCAFGGGLVLGLSLFLSFGLTALGLPALVVVLVHARQLGWSGVVRVLAAAAVGVGAVVALFALGGYWWFDGLSVDAGRVRSGPSYRARPLGFFLFANLAAGAIAAGPAAIAGLGALGRRALAALPLAAVAAMLVSDSSGLVRGETERIWLPFTIWVGVATAFLPARFRRIWLLLAVAVAICVEVRVRTEW
jgi:hypothetical protein